MLAKALRRLAKALGRLSHAPRAHESQANDMK